MWEEEANTLILGPQIFSNMRTDCERLKEEMANTVILTPQIFSIMETDCEEVRGGGGYHSDPLTSNVPMYFDAGCMYFDAGCDCLHQTRLIAY